MNACTLETQRHPLKGQLHLSIRLCRYCGGVIRLVPAKKIYGASTDRLGLTDENIYLCQNCNARVRRQLLSRLVRYQYSPWGIPVSGATVITSRASP